MGTKLKCICLMFATSITFSFAPSTAFATGGSSSSADMQYITESYYCSDFASNASNKSEDPFKTDYTTVVKQYQVDSSMSTQVEVDSLVAALEGSLSLLGMAISNGQYYAKSHLHPGEVGTAILNENGEFMQSFDGDNGEIFALPSQAYMRKNLSSMLDLSQAKARLIIIPNFSSGILFYEGEQEQYYILTCINEQAINNIYSVSSLAELIEDSRSMIITPPLNYTVDENGLVIPDTGGVALQADDMTKETIWIFAGIALACAMGMLWIRRKKTH